MGNEKFLYLLICLFDIILISKLLNFTVSLIYLIMVGGWYLNKLINKDNILEFLLETVNGWIKHAEGKHAVLIGLNAGVISLLLNILDFDNWTWTIITIYIMWIILLLIVSIIFSSISYLSILDSSFFNKSNKNINIKKSNPFYFKDIALMKPVELIQFFKTEPPLNEEIHIAEQIIVNSKIAFRKYQLFNKAIWIAFYGVFPPIAFILSIISFFLKRRKTND